MTKTFYSVFDSKFSFHIHFTTSAVKDPLFQTRLELHSTLCEFNSGYCSITFRGTFYLFLCVFLGKSTSRRRTRSETNYKQDNFSSLYELDFIFNFHYRSSVLLENITTFSTECHIFINAQNVMFSEFGSFLLVNYICQLF